MVVSKLISNMYVYLVLDMDGALRDRTENNGLLNLTGQNALLCIILSYARDQALYVTQQNSKPSYQESVI